MISSIAKEKMILRESGRNLSREEKLVNAARKLWAKGRFDSAIYLLYHHNLPFTVLDAVPVMSYVDILERVRFEEGLGNCLETKVSDLERVVNAVVNSDGDLLSARKEVEQALGTHEQYTSQQVFSLTGLLDQIDVQYRYKKMRDAVIGSDIPIAKKRAKVIVEDSIISSKYLTGAQMRYVVDIINLKETQGKVPQSIICFLREELVELRKSIVYGLRDFKESILNKFYNPNTLNNLYFKSDNAASSKRLRGPGVTRVHKVPTIFDDEDSWLTGEKLPHLIDRGFNYDLVVKPGYVFPVQRVSSDMEICDADFEIEF